MAIRGNLAERISREQRPPESNAVLAPIEAMYEDAKQGMRHLSLIVNESMAFYLGYQWGQPLESGFEIDTGERQETYNYIQAVTRAWVASNLRAMPSPQVVASHSTFDSLIRAQNSQKFVRSMMYDGTIPLEELIRGEVDTAVKGAVWYKVCFDPNGGRVVQIPKFTPKEHPSGMVVWEPEHDPLGNPVMTEAFEGAVKVEARDIIDILPDPNATREEEVGYIFERKTVPRYRLEAQFKYDVFGQPTKGRFSGARRDEMMEQRDVVERMARGVPLFGQYASAPENELCELVCFWVKPNPDLKKGRLFCWSGNVILADGPLPYDWPWILRNGANIVPGSLYAIGAVHPLKSPQRTLNLNASKKSEMMDRVQQTYLIADTDSELSVEALGDISGQVLWHRYGHPVSWLEPPNIPSSMFELETGLISMMRDVSSFHEISQGDAPPQIETGRGLAYLFEFQQGVRQPEVALFKVTVTRILNKALKIARDFYWDGKQQAILGEGSSWSWRAWRRDDYELESEVRIVPDGDAPNSPALRNAMALEYAQMGMLSDTPEAARFRRIVRFDWGDSKGFVDDRERQYQRVLAQIERVRENPYFPLIAEERDDPNVFLETLDQFRASPEYDQLIPVAKQSVDYYVFQFEDWIRMQQLDFAAQQNMFARQSTIKHSKDGVAAGGEEMASPFDGGFSDVEAMRFQGEEPQAFDPYAA